MHSEFTCPRNIKRYKLVFKYILAVQKTKNNARYCKGDDGFTKISYCTFYSPKPLEEWVPVSLEQWLKVTIHQGIEIMHWTVDIQMVIHSMRVS